MLCQKRFNGIAEAGAHFLDQLCMRASSPCKNAKPPDPIRNGPRSDTSARPVWLSQNYLLREVRYHIIIILIHNLFKFGVAFREPPDVKQISSV